MKSFGLLAWPLVIAIGLGAVFELGRQHERADWVLAQATEAGKARELYDDRLRHAQRAASAAQIEAQQARDHAAQLQQEVKNARTPLVRSAACRPAAGSNAGGGLPGDRGVAGPGQPEAQREAAGPPAEGDAPVLLTAGAVRLWDSALAGEHVPAGACAAADPSSGACAASTDYTVDDAWANHIHNAATCREDRARLNRLIEILRQRQPGAPE